MNAEFAENPIEIHTQRSLRLRRSPSGQYCFCGYAHSLTIVRRPRFQYGRLQHSSKDFDDFTLAGGACDRS